MAKKEDVMVKDFGRTEDGTKATLYTLENSQGDKASFTDYGAALVSLEVNLGEESRDIVLGYADVSDYEKNSGNLGATCGPFANRISNGEYRLNDSFYTLPKNDSNNVCHSGALGFHTRFWTLSESSADSLTFTCTMGSGQQAFPAELSVSVTYALTEERTLSINYEARTEQDTIINLTNHSYFNLAGEGVIDEQLIEVNASFYTPVDEELIPTGEILSVSGTGFDLRQARKLSDVFASDEEGIRSVGGLDHNFVIDGEERDELRYAARLMDPESELQVVCYTTEPGIQIYTANMLKDYQGSKDRTFGEHHGICFETQNFPDSPNIIHFPSPVLRKGDVFRSTTIYQFGPYKVF